MAIRTDRLRDLREKRGWTKREMAQLCGFGELQVYRYEAGVSEPSADKLKIMAEKLEASADYLLGLSDDPHGQLGDGLLTDSEQIMLDTFRREGWAGVARVSVEKLAEQLAQA